MCCATLCHVVPRCRGMLPRSARQGLWCLSRNSWASHGHVRVAKLSETFWTDFETFWSDWDLWKQFGKETVWTVWNSMEQYGTVAVTLSEQIWPVWHTWVTFIQFIKTQMNLSTHIFNVMQCNVLYCKDSMGMICSQKPNAYTFLIAAQTRFRVRTQISRLMHLASLSFNTSQLVSTPLNGLARPCGPSLSLKSLWGVNIFL